MIFRAIYTEKIFRIVDISMLNVKAVLSIISFLMIGATIAFFIADFFYRSKQESNRIRYEEDCENAGLDVLELFSEALLPSILAACLSVRNAGNKNLHDMFVATTPSLSNRDTIGYLSRLHDPTEASDFERDMSLLYGQNVTIADVGDEEREEAWALAYYYPEVVEFIGLDVYSERTRIDTVDKMVSSNRSSITPRLDLSSGRAGLYTLEPVFAGWDPVTYFDGQYIVGALLTLFYVNEFFGSTVLAKFLSANPKSHVRISISGEMVYDNFVNNTLDTVSASSAHDDDVYVYNTVVPGSLIDMEVTMSEYELPPRSVLFYSTFVGSSALVVMTVFSVVVQRKRREAEAESNFKTKFIADMSHEIRTPMNGIMGMSELLSDQELSHACKEYIRVIRSCGSNLMNIINDILDMSKIGANMMDLRPVSFRIINAVTHTVENVRVSYDHSNGLDRAGIQTVVIIGKDVPFKVVADDVRYKQILSNLFTNALKFTDKGTITISVRADAADGKGDNGGVYKITTSVADTGIGMSPEGLKKCFQSFAQVHTTARNVGGTGLGLSISKQLSNLMGGDLSCSSTLGKGTTFSYDVLVDTVPPNLKTTDEYRRVFDNKNFEDVKNVETEVYEQSSFDTNEVIEVQVPEDTIPVQPHILVVDDNKVNRLVASKILGTLGVKVDTCDNGMQAVQECDVQKFSAILMDMVMPVMGGVDATKQIRASGGLNSKTPIIFLSANVLGEHLQQCQDAGGDGFLSKPVKRSLVFEKISKHLAIGEVAHVMNHWGAGQV